MKTAIIIHGTGGNPNGNWFQWLKDNLEKLGYVVYVPKFPTPENQSLDNWMEVFERYGEMLDEDSILIGHSLGPSFILSVLEKLDRSIKAAFLVAGFLGKLDNEDFDELNRTFVDKEFDWVKIKKNCKEFFVVSSDDDPYVSLDKGKELATKLGIEVTVINDAGHLNSDSGYDKFELLLEKIRRLRF